MLSLTERFRVWGLGFRVVASANIEAWITWIFIDTVPKAPYQV